MADVVTGGITSNYAPEARGTYADSYALSNEARRDTFAALLQAHAAGLLSEDEARDILRRMRPEWFADA